MTKRQHRAARPGCPRCRSEMVKRFRRDDVPDWMECGECGAGWPIREGIDDA